MQLSSIGIIADNLLNEIKNHSRNIKLGTNVVMPNHVHIILVIEKYIVINNGNNQMDYPDHPNCRDKACLVSTNFQTDASINIKKSIGQQRFQNQGVNNFIYYRFL